ncbi:MAG: uncharacterized protein JWR69_82 [Pedosphaera sp.]|nr:uncharacterized protein [Pedosphaera sp.]
MPGDILKIELSEEAKAVLRNVQTLEPNALAGMARAMDRENQFTVSHIQQEYLSFGRGGPSSPIGLRVQSNRYRQSLRASQATIDGQVINSAIGSNATNKGVSYPAIHEFGAEIPPHKITASAGKMLRFQIGSRVIFRKSVNHPGMTLPARRPIGRGIQDRLTNYQTALSAAVLKALGGTTA